MTDKSERTKTEGEKAPEVLQAPQECPAASEPEPEAVEGEISLVEDDEYRTDLTNIIITSETVHPTLHRPAALYKLSPQRAELQTGEGEGEGADFDGTAPMETNPSPEDTSAGVSHELLASPGGAQDDLDCSMEEVKDEPLLMNEKASDVTSDRPFDVVPISPAPSDPLPTLMIQECTPPHAAVVASSADNDAEMPLEESNDSLFALDNTSPQNELSESLLASSEIVDSIIHEVNERGRAAEVNGDVFESDITKISAECQKEYLDNSEEILTLNVNESLNSSTASVRDQEEAEKGKKGAENFDEISDIENWDDIEGGDDELWKISLQPCVSSREEREEAKKCEDSRGMKEQMSPISSGDEFGDNEERGKREGSAREGESEGEEGEDKNQVVGQSILVIGGGAASHGRYQSRSRDRGFDYNEPLSPPPNSDPPPKPQESKSSNANLTRIIKLSEDATSDISDSSFKDTIEDFEEVSRTKHKPSKSRRVSRSHESSSHSKDLAFSDKLFVDAKYFIMKSNNHENIRIAKEKYVWSTPLPNEKKLSQSYRQHKNIILLFSVRESGRFQGFARLASDVKRSGPPIQWHLPHGINANSLGGIFRLQWICKEDLEFSKCQDVSNPWNDHKPVKISRDGQELPPGIGEKLCRLWFERPETPPATTPTAKPSVSSPNEPPTSSDTQQQTTTSSLTNTSTSQAFTTTAPLHYPAFPYPYMQPGATAPHSVQFQSYLAQAQQQMLAAQGVRPYGAYPYLQQIQNYAAMAQSMQALSHAQQANKLALWNAENQQQRKAMVAAMSYLKEAGFSKTKSPNSERTPSPTSKRRRMSSDTSSKKSQHDIRHPLRSGKEKSKESRSYHRSNSSRSAKSRHSSSSKHRRYSSSRKYSSSKSHKERHRTRSRSSSSPHTQEYESDNKKSFQMQESGCSPDSLQTSPVKDPTQEFGVKEEIFLHGSYDDYLKEMQLKGVHSASQSKQKSRESTST